MKIIKGLKLKAPQLRGDKGMIKERRENGTERDQKQEKDWGDIDKH